MIIQIPRKCLDVLSAKKRYKILRGGRGSAKSWSVAKYLLVRAAFSKVRILCVREIQNSIKDSVHKVLCDQIDHLKLNQYFKITETTIKSKSGSEFFFKGIRSNVSEIKSTEGVDICWVEEAEKVSEDSWTILDPTIRKDDSEIIITFNPEEEESATYQRFVKNPPAEDQIASAEVNYYDNPWFPKSLERVMQRDKEVDFDKYEHVWLGKTKRYSNALIFKNKVRIESFETPLDAQLYFGADFGFSVDPSVLGRMFISDERLFIDYEAYAVGIEIEELPAFYLSVPDSKKWRITADSQRPDTISFLSQKGFNIISAEKGAGSVEDGIEFIRSFREIIIHPRCRGAIDNFTNYKWKQDRITKEILPIPAQGSDHWPDTARYALERYIKKKVSIFDVDYSNVQL